MPLTTKEKSEQAQRLLAAYVREVKHYRAMWGVPVDRTTHLDAWAKARGQGEADTGRGIPTVTGRHPGHS